MIEDKAMKRGRGHYLEGALRGSHDGGLPVKEVVADGAGRALGGRVAAQVLKFLVDSLQSHFVGGGGGGGVWARRRWRRWSGREVDGVTRLRRWLRREAADADLRCSPTEIFSVARKTRSGSAAFFRPFRPSRGISFSSLFFSLFSMSSLHPFFRLLSASFPLSFLSSVLSRQRLLTDSSRDERMAGMDGGSTGSLPATTIRFMPPRSPPEQREEGKRGNAAELYR